MTRQLLCVLLVFLASAGFVAWRVYAVHTYEAPQFEIVKDPSASHEGGCESLAGLTGQALETNAAGPGSTVTVLVLGDQSTAGQPWRMGTYSVPTIRKVLEGRSAKLRQQEQILQDVSGKCQALRQTTVSPIFLGVTQAIADLRARGCSASSHCDLFVDTDLEENVEPVLKKALSKKDGEKWNSLPRLGNSGIDVLFCGVAVTNGRVHDTSEKREWKFVRRDSSEVHRMQEVWRSLFAEPATVHFEPYCPVPGNGATQNVTGASPKQSQF